jgi:hypothetical protein
MIRPFKEYLVNICKKIKKYGKKIWKNMEKI